jgi:DNA-binding beta-propeller fold protein YncE
LSWGSKGSAEGQFETPGDIAIEPGGNWIYVLDKGNRRVQRFGSRGEFSREWGIQGDATGEFQAPSTIVIDDSGFIYIGDIEGRRVQKFDDRGNFQWEADTTVPDGG